MTDKRFDIPAGERDFDTLYRRFGYKLFRMNRFEEYSLYAENKSFLVSDRVITFNDPSGRLMALKPDITLSIAKGCPDDGSVQKFYYNENVYRVDTGSDEFREIVQSGLECMGSVDRYSVCEVLMLAVKSLELISDECVLDISDMSILAAILDDAAIPAPARKRALEFFEMKNAHGLRDLFDQCGVPSEKTDVACEAAQMYGRVAELIPRLREILPAGARYALNELEAVYAMLDKMGVSERLRLDFSIVNDMHYYNGLTFRGFVFGSPKAVLSGGRYDRLMERLGKKAQAIGFAVYLDALADMETNVEWDVDVLLLYGDDTTDEELVAAIDNVTRDGRSVRVAREIPRDIRSRRICRIAKGAIEDVR